MDSRSRQEERMGSRSSVNGEGKKNVGVPNLVKKNVGVPNLERLI